MNRPQNPYIAGNPISDQDRFIGRADVLRETLRILRNPNTNALVLHGQRRIGKTSILLRLQKDLPSSAYCPVYFDLQDKAAAPLGDVLYQLAQSIAQATQAGWPERSRFDNDGDFFRQQFLPNAAQQVAPRTLVLLFDEFDVLDLPQEGQAGSAFFPYLRTWMAQTEAVKFVFVLGRRPEELSTDTLATFKGTQSVRVSLMSQAETLEIVRLAEKNQSLAWRQDALAQIWQWTQGHPYFTQLLCSEIWEAAYDDQPTAPPTIAASDVENAITDALEQGANAFHWIWNGLPHAERIVMAAMAEEKAETISQQQLTEVLNRSGVRLILRELDLAPEMLEKWDLLRRAQTTNPTDGGAYRFAIPLLKRWVQENEPLRRVKAELDSIEPLAMSLYRSAVGIYGRGDLERAEQLLLNALDVNPNHMQSRLLLGRVQLGKGNPLAAVETLAAVYAFDAALARQDYVAALLAWAEVDVDVERRLVTYQRILKIEPGQPVAKERWTIYWQQQAEIAIKNANYEAALNAYQQLGDQISIKRVLTLQRKAQLTHLVTTSEEHEKAEQRAETIETYTERLLTRFLDINPNHIQSRLLLGRVQLGKGNPAAAVETLDTAYAFDPGMVRQDYVAALLALAEADIDAEHRLATYGRILKIEPDQPIAKEHWTIHWQRQAKVAVKKANYEAALNAYQQLGDQASINYVLTLQGKAKLSYLVTTAENHEKAERWAEAVETYTQLLAKFPDDETWQKRLNTTKEEAELATLYDQALGVIQEKKWDAVLKLLAQVISRRPGYKESARYLLIALQGDDVTILKQKLVAMISQRDSLQTQLETATQKVKTQQAQIAKLEKEVAELHPLNPAGRDEIIFDEQHTVLGTTR